MRKAVCLFIFIFIILGFKSAKSADSLHFTFPTADSKLSAGSDTLINWDGIAPTDSVQLEYSIDNGITWLMLSSKAVGLKYQWENIPNKIGTGYLMRLIHKGESVNKLDEPYIEWKKTFGGSQEDILYNIIEIKEGGYMAIGCSRSWDGDLDSNRGDWDFWLLKLDSKGNKLLSKAYGGNSSDVYNCIIQTKDLGFLVGGSSMSEDFGCVPDPPNISKVQSLIKFDKNSNLVWRKNYGNGNDPFWCIIETEDGGFITIRDSTYINPCSGDSRGTDHILIMKIDSKGNYQWSRNYSGGSFDEPRVIKKTKDGGYILIGITASDCGDVTENKGKVDIWILKLDKIGKLEWQRTYGGSQNEFGTAIMELNNGNYQIIATTESNDYDIKNFKGGVCDVLAIQINSQGDFVWSKNIGGSGWDGNVIGNNVIGSTSDNGLIFCASTTSRDGDLIGNLGDSDGWFVKLDYVGNIKYQRNFGGSNNDNFFSTQQTLDSSYIICGSTNSYNGDVTENKGGYDGWIIKLSTKYQTIDTVSTTFSIVAPQPAAKSVDMGMVFVGEWRDSTVAEFVYNMGSYKFRVDSIYFTGTDKSAFNLIGGFPKYNVEPDSGKEARFRFTPTRVGMHYAKIVIVTQADTLIRSIIGEGLTKRAKIQTTAEPFTNLICNNSTNTTVEITSTGGETLIIKELNITGTDYKDFSINEPLPINLPPDSSKTITIGFKTNVPGIKTAALEIKSNAYPDSVLMIPLTARKDSVALVPNPTLIDLGTIFPNQTKDSSFVISNFGTIETDGKISFTSNISCANPTFTVDSGGVYKLDFTFTSLPAEGNINEKITVWDDVCKYSREVLITGKVLSPDLQGFLAIQCKSYSNEYKLTLQNPSSNRLKITSIVIEKNPNLFEIDQSLIFPITIEPFAVNYEVKVKYQDNTAQKFSTAVNCITDNKFIPVLTDTIYAETVDYKRTTIGLINDSIHNASNPFAVSYDSESQNGKDKFTYSIQVNESANDMDYLIELSDLEIVINYNRNVLGADFDTKSGNVKVRLGEDLESDYSIKSAKETKIDEFNSQIIVNLENTGKPITKKAAYILLEIDFSAYLSNFGLSDEQNSEKSRSAIISHTITTTDDCIEYETANNAVLSIEKLCTDDIRSIKMSNDSSAKFYLGAVIPHPIGSKGATIEYGLGFECQVTLTIYDLAGIVKLIPINEIQKAGIHKQIISSKSLSAGAYFIEMKAGPFKETKRVIVE